MKQIVVKGNQGIHWDEAKEEFVHEKPQKDFVLRLEHSLISISKWEAKWCKPFIDTEKTDEETIDYIKCMALNSEVPDDVYSRLTQKNILEIREYIEAPMTATKISDSKVGKKTNNE